MCIRVRADADDINGAKLPGAVFRLYKVDLSTGAETMVAEMTTGDGTSGAAKGEALFDNLNFDVLYYLTETTAPDGYVPVSYTHLDVYKRQQYSITYPNESDGKKMTFRIKFADDFAPTQSIDIRYTSALDLDGVTGPSKIFKNNANLSYEYGGSVYCLLYTSRCV